MPTPDPNLSTAVTDVQHPGALPDALSQQVSGLRVWGVAALVRALADALDARFNPVAVTGEITGFSRASSGHCYFTLKEVATGGGASGGASGGAGGGLGAVAEGAISCAMFRRAAGLLDFEPRNGDVVTLRGRLGVYEARGSLQIVAESMQRATLSKGNLWEQFERLKAKLSAEGLFDASRKRPLPHFVRSVAVVTSLTAAALADVRATLARRLPHVQVWLMPASVQGVGAAQELVKSLLKIEQSFTVDTGHIANSTGFLPPEVVLLVRGGGSMEDLWAFNDEALARAIAACSIPVISGVGHETDFSLADFAADLRAPTPTAAAELLCEPTSAWHALADQQQGRLQAALERSLDRFAQRLDFLGNRLHRPAGQVQRAQLRQSALQHRIRTAVLRKLEHTNTALSAHSSVFTEKFAARIAAEHRRLERTAARLEAINPHLVLQRGYAFMTDTSGTPLTRAAQFTNARDVRAVLADGTVDLRVRSKPGLEFLQSSLI